MKLNFVAVVASEGELVTSHYCHTTPLSNAVPPIAIDGEIVEKLNILELFYQQINV